MQVFCRLQKLMICVSSDSTLKLIETLGFDHDKGVLEWRDHLYQRLEQEIPEVSTSEPIMLMLLAFNISMCNSCRIWSYMIHMTGPVVMALKTASLDITPLMKSCSSAHLLCTTPSLMYHTPEAPQFSPLSSTSLATLSRSPESMSIFSQSSFGHEPEGSLVSILGPQNAEETHASTCRDQVQGKETLPQVGRGWFGFKIVGDNIDKNVRPQHQSVDTRTQSLHYFHAFAALDHVNLSLHSEIRPNVNLTEFDLQCLLSSPEDLDKLKINFEVHIARIITKYIYCYHLD